MAGNLPPFYAGTPQCSAQFSLHAQLLQNFLGEDAGDEMLPDLGEDEYDWFEQRL